MTTKQSMEKAAERYAHVTEGGVIIRRDYEAFTAGAEWMLSRLTESKGEFGPRVFVSEKLPNADFAHAFYEDGSLLEPFCHVSELAAERAAHEKTREVLFGKREAIKFMVEIAGYLVQPHKPLYPDQCPTYYHTLSYDGDLKMREDFMKYKKMLESDTKEGK